MDVPEASQWEVLLKETKASQLKCDNCKRALPPPIVNETVVVCFQCYRPYDLIYHPDSSLNRISSSSSSFSSASTASSASSTSSSSIDMVEVKDGGLVSFTRSTEIGSGRLRPKNWNFFDIGDKPDQMPWEIMAEITKYLNATDLASMNRLSKQLHYATNHTQLWKGSMERFSAETKQANHEYKFEQAFLDEEVNTLKKLKDWDRSEHNYLDQLEDLAQGVQLQQRIADAKKNYAYTLYHNNRDYLGKAYKRHYFRGRVAKKREDELAAFRVINAEAQRIWDEGDMCAHRCMLPCYCCQCWFPLCDGCMYNPQEELNAENCCCANLVAGCGCIFNLIWRASMCWFLVILCEEDGLMCRCMEQCCEVVCAPCCDCFGYCCESFGKCCYACCECFGECCECFGGCVVAGMEGCGECCSSLCGCCD